MELSSIQLSKYPSIEKLIKFIIMHLQLKGVESYYTSIPMSLILNIESFLYPIIQVSKKIWNHAFLDKNSLKSIIQASKIFVESIIYPLTKFTKYYFIEGITELIQSSKYPIVS